MAPSTRSLHSDTLKIYGRQRPCLRWGCVVQVGGGKIFCSDLHDLQGSPSWPQGVRTPGPPWPATRLGLGFAPEKILKFTSMHARAVQNHMMAWLILSRTAIRNRTDRMQSMKAALLPMFCGLSVCWSRLWALQKRMNWSKCCLGWVAWNQRNIGAIYYMGFILAPPGEHDWMMVCGGDAALCQISLTTCYILRA